MQTQGKKDPVKEAKHNREDAAKAEKTKLKDAVWSEMNTKDKEALLQAALQMMGVLDEDGKVV